MKLSFSHYSSLPIAVSGPFCSRFGLEVGRRTIYCHCNCYWLSMRPITINNVLLSHFYKQFISTLDMTENRFHWFTGTIFSLTSQVQGAIYFTSWVYIDTPLHPLVESKCRDGQNFWLHYLREQDNCQVFITIQDVVTAHKKKQNCPVPNHLTGKFAVVEFLAGKTLHGWRFFTKYHSEVFHS